MHEGVQVVLARAGAPPDREPTRQPIPNRRRVAAWRAREIVLAATFLAIGALAGFVAGRATATAGGHREGACAALRMAAALGYLDDRQRRLVMHNLATALNPDVDLFPGGRRAIERACEAAAGRS